MSQESSAYANSFANPPKSFWIASTPETHYPALTEDQSVDVCIIGGGITGITSAYLLTQEGLRVAVLEADRIVMNTSAHTTAKLTSQHDIFYSKLQKQMGREVAQIYAQSNEQAIRFVADLVQSKGIDCDFSWQPAYIYTQSDEYVEQLAEEARVAGELGLRAVYEDTTPLPFEVKAALRFNDQAQFHPRKYLLALAKDISDQGGLIFEQSRVVDIKGDCPYAIYTENGKRVKAQYVIMASHYPCHNFKGWYFTRLYPERAYALAVKAKETFPGGMYINAENPTRSLRSLPTDEGELILIVGEKHKTGHGENLVQHYENLKQFAEQHFTVESTPYRWSTQDLSTPDEIPYIGLMTAELPRFYIGTGFKKWGMTLGTVSALLLRDLILDRHNPWAEIYNPLRSTLGASAKTFIVENVDVAVSLISGKLKPADGDGELQPGEAKVIIVDGQKVGVYKDEQGNLHKVDTSCTHLGCELQWNNAEKSWDCPCHGSRFTVDGEILEGPAFKPLKKIE